MFKRNTGKELATRASWLSSLLSARCPNCGTPTISTLFWHCPTCGYPAKRKMICPNCGQPTARTADWSCQWCEYPLTSTLYKALPAEAKIAASPITIETPVPAVPPVSTPVEIITVTTPESPPENTNTAEPPSVIELPATAAELVPPEPVTALTTTPVAVIPPTAPPSEEPEIVEMPPVDETNVTMTELQTAFQTDSVLADANFKGKVLKVKGLVAGIQPAAVDASPTILMSSESAEIAQKIHCTFDVRFEAPVKRMAVGQKVTVVGKYDGFDTDIRLIDCMPVG